MMRKTGDRNNYRWLVLILLGVLFWGIPGVFAQEPGPIVIISQVDDQNFPLVTAKVTVVDESGLAIDTLTPGDFLVWEDNQAARNVSVSLVPPDQAEAVSLVLVLDVSGSMDEPDANGILKIDAARAEAKSLLNSLGPNDQVALISFSEAITVEQSFTTDRVALHTAVDGLHLDGDTALNNALFKAAELAGSLPPGKKAIILLTDGLNTHGNLTLDDALDRARRSGTPVYTVGFFTGGIDPATRSKAEAALTRIATVTNGRYFAAPTAQELGVAFQTLSQLLRLQYALSFESSLVADCKTHELKVRVTHQNQDGDDFDVFNACPPRAPTIHLTGPADGDIVSKVVSFTPQIDPPAEIAAVEYQIDGASPATFTAPPFSFEWDATYASPGLHILVIVITDSIGDVHTIERRVTVASPITLKIVAPVEGQTLSDPSEAKVEVAGPGKISRVEFLWNGEPLDTDSSPPFVASIDARQYLDGEYTLLVRAYEVDGYSTEQAVIVRVESKVRSDPLPWIILGAGILILALMIPLGIRARRRAVETIPVPPPLVDYAPSPASTTPPAWLEVIRGSTPGQRFVLTETETTLGRSRTENDISIEGRTASRRQATISVSDGRYVYYDLEPTNPSIINNQEIAGFHELYEGDQIEIGDMVLKFTFEEGQL